MNRRVWLFLAALTAGGLSVAALVTLAAHHAPAWVMSALLVALLAIDVGAYLLWIRRG